MKKFSVKPKLTTKNSFLLSEIEKAEETVFIGRLAETGQIVNINLDVALPRVLTIFGKRGSGKSYTLGSIVEGLCIKSDHSIISTAQKTQAILLFDTLGIFQWMDIPVSEHTKSSIVQKQYQTNHSWGINEESVDVSFWSPRGASSELEGQKDFVLNARDLKLDDLSYLMGIDLVKDILGQLLTDVFEKVRVEGWTDGKRHFLANQVFILDDLLNCIDHDIDLDRIYHSETRRALYQRLKSLAQNKFLDFPSLNNNTSASLTDLLSPGHLSVLLLHKLPQEFRLVLIISLIRRIISERIDSSERSKQAAIIGKENYSQGIPPCWIVIDEAQNFLPSEKTTNASETIVRLVREGRNYGISFALTTQQPSAIDNRILAQVDTMICHKLTVQSDIDCVKRNLKSSLPDQISYGGNNLDFDDLMRSLDTGQALVTSTDTLRSFIMDIRPRVSVHGGFSI